MASFHRIAGWLHSYASAEYTACHQGPDSSQDSKANPQAREEDVEADTETNPETDPEAK